VRSATRGAGHRHAAALLRRLAHRRSKARRSGGDRVLRVCEDPNNLPFSNRAGEGFENKIAELLARELGWTLEYTWFPQRMGFIRKHAARARSRFQPLQVRPGIGGTGRFELASTTKPYYRSTYALVYAKGKGLDSVTAPEGCSGSSRRS